MTVIRPYLVRALHEWIVDNDLTPHVIVDARVPGTEVPAQYIQDGHIVLNLNPSAVQDLVMGNEWISFKARFSGKVAGVRLPIHAVLAIYAKENGQGMNFSEESTDGETTPPPTPPSPPGPSAPQARPGRPFLKIVK